MESYKELVAWQNAMELVSAIYMVTKRFPREEVYGLTSQLRRSAVSVPSNIAEGQGRATRGEFVQFLCHARGSLFEAATQLIVARQLGYLQANESTELSEKLSRVARLLNGLITSLRPANKNPSTIHHSPST